MSDRLFVYGTLRDDGLVRRLTGRQFVTTAAVLAGYRRDAPSGGYPRIVPAAGSAVHGVLLHDVGAASLRALDAYEDEGRLYRRTLVTVTSRGMACPAHTYVGLG